jgi:cyclopropane fatty-acyl-phospholipid synthase-like methyltransferase
MVVNQGTPERSLSPELNALSVSNAKKQGVVPDIHPDDFIFHFLINNPCFPSHQEAVEYYFTDGANSAKKLADLLYSDLKFPKEKPLKLLEFASGYGCVTRHFSQQLPDVTITACDIHKEAINFVRDHFSTETLLSESVPEKLILNQEYDVVFALSFFSHMPESSWGRWIKTLYSGVKENGFLIFTTQGKESAKFFNNPVIPTNGFWFLPDSEQKDLDSNEYGQTIVTPDFVIAEIYRQVRAPLVIYRYAYWWGHQDLYVVEKLCCHQNGVTTQ